MWPRGPDNRTQPTALPSYVESGATECVAKRTGQQNTFLQIFLFCERCDKMCGQEDQTTEHSLQRCPVLCERCDRVCGQEDQTTERSLQRCPLLRQAVRQNVWPRGSDNGARPATFPSSASGATECVAKRTRQQNSAYSVALCSVSGETGCVAKRTR